MDASKAQSLDETRKLIDTAYHRVEMLKVVIATAPAKLGAKGGKKTAALMTAKDPDYFKKLAAMRKTNAGGRPKKDSAE